MITRLFLFQVLFSCLSSHLLTYDPSCVPLPSCNKEPHIIAYRQPATDTLIPLFWLYLLPRMFLWSHLTPAASCCSNLLNCDHLQCLPFLSVPSADMLPSLCSPFICQLQFVNCSTCSYHGVQRASELLNEWVARISQ